MYRKVIKQLLTDQLKIESRLESIKVLKNQQFQLNTTKNNNYYSKLLATLYTQSSFLTCLRCNNPIRSPKLNAIPCVLLRILMDPMIRVTFLGPTTVNKKRQKKKKINVSHLKKPKKKTTTTKFQHKT